MLKLALKGAADGGKCPFSCCFGEQYLAGRPYADALQRCGGSLSNCIKKLQPLDLIAEQFDPHWLVAGRRRDINNASPHRKLTDLIYQINPLIAQINQCCDQVVTINFLAHGQFPARLNQRHLGHRLVQYCFDACYNEGGLACAQPLQDCQPLRHFAALGLHAVVER